MDAQNAAATNTGPAAPAEDGSGTTQLPAEILLDRHLVRAERLLVDGNPADALEAMDEARALQEEHDLVVEDSFHFEYARVAFAAGRTETAIASANAYLVAVGREGSFYREALELLDSVDASREQEAAERRQAEAERRRARRRAEAERLRRAEAQRQAEIRRLEEARRLGPTVLWISFRIRERTLEFRANCRPLRVVQEPSAANLLVLDLFNEFQVYDASGERLLATSPNRFKERCNSLTRGLSDQQLTDKMGDPRDSAVFLTVGERSLLKAEHRDTFRRRCPSVPVAGAPTSAEFFIVQGTNTLRLLDRSGTTRSSTGAVRMQNRLKDMCNQLVGSEAGWMR